MSAAVGSSGKIGVGGGLGGKLADLRVPFRPDTCEIRGAGGEGGIRTHGTLARTTVFETAPIGHSGTSPWRALIRSRPASRNRRAARGNPSVRPSRRADGRQEFVHVVAQGFGLPRHLPRRAEHLCRGGAGFARRAADPFDIARDLTGPLGRLVHIAGDLARGGA